MIRVQGKKLRQWDLDRVVEVDACPGKTLEAIRFKKSASVDPLTVAFDEDGEKYVAEIPNVLLKNFGTLVVEAVWCDDLGEFKTERAAFEVCRCKKPDDYEYTETEVLELGSGGASSWNDLKDKPFGTEMTEVTVSVVEEVELPGFRPFAAGDTVTVKVNGVEHTLVAFGDGSGAVVGDVPDDLFGGGGSYGWFIGALEDACVCVCPNGCTVSYMCETIRKIDTKYLPGYAINLSSLPFADNWYSEGTETTSMSKEQWKEMVALAKDNNKMVCGGEPGIYSMFYNNDDGEVVMTRTDIYTDNGKINVGDHEKRLTYDEEQQLCTCTYSGELLHVTGE